MLQLIAASTNRLALAPTGEPDNVTLEAADADGTALAFGTAAQDGAEWAVDVQSDDVPAIGTTGALTWTITKGTQKRTITENFEVVAFPAIITERAVESSLQGGAAGNPAVLALVVAATNADVADELGGFTYPAVTESRHVFVDGPTAYPHELLAVDAIATLSGTPVGCTAIQGSTRPHIRWLEFEDHITRTLSVTGRWGWDQVPDDIRLAALSAAVTRYQRHAFTVDADRIGNLGSLPRQTLEVLARYKV
jgi:hypothetical protein